MKYELFKPEKALIDKGRRFSASSEELGILRNYSKIVKEWFQDLNLQYNPLYIIDLHSTEGKGDNWIMTKVVSGVEIMLKSFVLNKKLCNSLESYVKSLDLRFPNNANILDVFCHTTNRPLCWNRVAMELTNNPSILDIEAIYETKVILNDLSDFVIQYYGGKSQ